MIAYKVQLCPNNLQTTRLFQFAGAARYAYNWSIDQQKANYQAGGKFISGYSLTKQFTRHKRQPGNEWIYTISNDVFHRAILDCCQAYQRMFKKIAKHPRYKSRRRGNFSFYQNSYKIQFTATHVRIEVLHPNRKRKHLYWVKLAESNRIPVNAKYYNPRITYDGLHWWVSVAVDTPARMPIIAYADPIGIDLGVKELAVCSDGAIYHNINKTPRVKKLKKKQRRLQRQVSRKYRMNKAEKNIKTSNIRKQEQQVRKIYQQLKNVRQSYMIQVVHQIVQRHPSCIVMEDLNVRGMMKNKHLSAAIQEQGFYQFRATMENYAKRMGIPIKYADRWYPSSKKCSNCGHLKTDLKLSDRVYKCDQCGLEINRDYNAALNLKQLA